MTPVRLTVRTTVWFTVRTTFMTTVRTKVRGSYFFVVLPWFGVACTRN